MPEIETAPTVVTGDSAGPVGEERDRLQVEQRFAMVPEWLLDADVPDGAVRLYALLTRYGNSSGARFPSRALLARRLRRSVDSVDRAMRELETAGAVVVHRRKDGAKNLRNLYEVRFSPPGAPEPAARPTPDLPAAVRPTRGGGRRRAATRPRIPCPRRPSAARGGRTAAATPGRGPASSAGRAAAGSRTAAATGGRTAAAAVAAPVRHDRESSTQRKIPPPAPPIATLGARAVDDGGGGGDRRQDEEGEAGQAALLAAVGLADPGALDDLARQVAALRLGLGRSTSRWTARRLFDALRDAVNVKGWPPATAVPALLAVAGDRATGSPMRLGCPGPWWDTGGPDGPTRHHRDEDELQRLEAVLADADGRRVHLQRQAREELAAQGLPITRLGVARQAVALLRAHGPG